MRISLVEDDERIAKTLAEDLRHQHQVVDLAYDGIEGWNCFQSVMYDLTPHITGCQLRCASLAVRVDAMVRQLR